MEKIPSIFEKYYNRRVHADLKIAWKFYPWGFERNEICQRRFLDALFRPATYFTPNAIIDVEHSFELWPQPQESRPNKKRSQSYKFANYLVLDRYVDDYVKILKKTQTQTAMIALFAVFRSGLCCICGRW